MAFIYTSFTSTGFYVSGPTVVDLLRIIEIPADLHNVISAAGHSSPADSPAETPFDAEGIIELPFDIERIISTEGL